MRDHCHLGKLCDLEEISGIMNLSMQLDPVQQHDSLHKQLLNPKQTEVHKYRTGLLSCMQVTA